MRVSGQSSFSFSLQRFTCRAVGSTKAERFNRSRHRRLNIKYLDATPFSPLDVTSALNSLPLPDPTHAVWSALEIYVSAKTSRGTVLAGGASWTSRRTLSVVSREKVGSPQRSQIWAGMCSTRTGRPSIVNTSLTNSFLAAVLPQTWQLNMANSVSGNQPIHSGLAHKL